MDGVETDAALRAQYGDWMEFRPFARVNASGTSAAKAERLLGWRPTRSWRDYLGDGGEPLPERSLDKLRRQAITTATVVAVRRPPAGRRR